MVIYCLVLCLVVQKGSDFKVTVTSVRPKGELALQECGCTNKWFQGPPGVGLTCSKSRAGGMFPSTYVSIYVVPLVGEIIFRERGW